MSANIPVDFVFRNVEVADATALLTMFGTELTKAGYAKDDYTEALISREAEFPTGIPVPDGVAIPHTDGSHVLKDTLGVAVLKEPISFNEMGGGPEDTVDVRVAILIALSNGKSHMTMLTNVIGAIQKSDFIKSLINAKSDDEIRSLVSVALEA